MSKRTAPVYSLFDLRIDNAQRSESAISFSASVTESPGGRGSSQTVLEVSDAELGEIGEIATSTRISGEEASKLERFGAKLFQALMSDKIGALYLSGYQRASEHGGGLRIRLTLPSDLTHIPWEFAFDRYRNANLGRSAKTALSRYVEIPAAETLPVKLPLRILFVSSLPRDLPPLSLSLEQKKIERVLRELESQNLVKFDFLPHATLSSLRQKLLDYEYHVVHFMCHGGFEPAARESFVVLEGDDGLSQSINATQLQHLLRDTASTRLVVLNACVTSDIAMLLGQAGIPAVVAMQYEVLDDSALVFAERFYSLIATGWPVDAAISEARNEIGLNFPRRADWATPILYMRSDTGMIFDVITSEVSGSEPDTLLRQPTSRLSYRRLALSLQPSLTNLETLHAESNQLANYILNSLSGPGALRLDSEVQEEFGERIFNSLFSDERDKELYESYERLKADEGLRLQLELADDPHLWRIPWELVYGGPEIGFMAAAAPRTLFSRVVPTRLRRRLSQLQFPLKMLVVMSEPPGVDVGCKQEEELLWSVLRPFREKQLVSIDIRWNPSPYEFQQWTSENSYHIVYFSGIDARMSGFGEGIVLVEEQKPRYVEVNELCAVFRGQNTVRLVILNTCLTAEVVSPAIVRSGVPSVVGMQYPFDARAGTVFPKYFFTTLFGSEPLFAVDLAVAQARTAFYVDEKNFGRSRVDWITPVLTTSVTDGNFIMN